MIRCSVSQLRFLPLLLALLAGCAGPQSPTRPISVETHFTPQEQIAPIVVELIDHAQQTLDIAAFGFTHKDIAGAVVRAHERGVRVRMVMDGTSAADRYSLVKVLRDAGIPLRVGHKHGFQHSKYLVIDDAIVVTGSYNFTRSADERNSENLLVIRNAPEVIRAFLEDYQRLREDSVRFDPSE